MKGIVFFLSKKSFVKRMEGFGYDCRVRFRKETIIKASRECKAIAYGRTFGGANSEVAPGFVSFAELCYVGKALQNSVKLTEPNGMDAKLLKKDSQ